MLKVGTLACLCLSPRLISCGVLEDFSLSLDDGIHLLQLRASPTVSSNSSVTAVRSREDPGNSERAQCPHEIEAELAAQGDKRFGCEGTLRSHDTVVCSFWGEPHITKLFTGEFPGNDVLYKSGLFRMGAANDGSWEVQVFNCGVFAGAVAARFGKSLIEVFVDSEGQMVYYLNGEQVSLPAEGIHGVKLDSTHRSIRRENQNRAAAHYPGTCADAPNGQVNIDIAQDARIYGNGRMNLNIKIEAASDSVTTKETDEYSICNVEVTPGRNRHGRIVSTVARWADWETKMVEPENSLFTIGNRMCAGCNGVIGWDDGRGLGKGSDVTAGAFCSAQVGKDSGQVTLESICRGANIAVADAASACEVLQDKPQFFQDCQIDYCASGGDMVPVEEAVEEEELENPQPKCVQGDCDAAAKCCGALQSQSILTLDNVEANDLCSGGELRYGSALTQTGQTIDLVVKPVGEYECRGKINDSKFGSRNSELGVLAVNAGTSQAFDFTFVQTGTDIPVEPRNVMITFVDIDQGKKDKQRESIEVCGEGDFVTTDDTELDIVVSGNCVKATSTTPGTGKDNPDSVEGMSQMQRARTVAFEVQGSSFTTTLSVSSGGGFNPRRFLFAGHPSVACVLK